MQMRRKQFHFRFCLLKKRGPRLALGEAALINNVYIFNFRLLFFHIIFLKYYIQLNIQKRYLTITKSLASVCDHFVFLSGIIVALTELLAFNLSLIIFPTETKCCFKVFSH